MKAKFSQFASEKGSSMMEYALIVSLIAVVSLMSISSLGRNARDKLSYLENTWATMGVEGPDEEGGRNH